MSELFGAPSGISAYLKDEHTQATTRYNNSMAAKAEEETSQAQRLQALMQQEGASPQQIGSVQDPAAKLMNLSNLAFRAGSVKMGTELAGKASEIQRRQVLNEQSLSTIEKQELESNLKLSQLARELSKGATDQISWQKANATFEMLTGQKSPFAAMPYSPELVGTIQNSMITTEQKLRAEYNAAEHERKVARDKQDAIDKALTRGLRSAELELKRGREARLAKNGGSKMKPAGMPTEREVDEARNLLKDMGLPKGDLDDVAEEVAQEARRMWKNNPALTPKEAIAKVLFDKQKSGDLVPGESNMIMPNTGKAFSPLRPMANPGSKEKLVPGQYYTTPRGVARWNGQTFSLAKLPQMNIAAEDEEEDEDD